MSTLAPSSHSLAQVSSQVPTPGVYRAPRRLDGTRGLAALMLAALVAALVLVADHLISTWAYDHLLMAWVAMWVVIFAGLALFAGTARRLASHAQTALDGWSRTLAEARAEARLWDMARSDPRLMGELVQARMRETDAEQTLGAVGDFSEALAPLGMDVKGPEAPPLGGWDRFVERLGEQRRRNLDLYYI